MNNTDGLAWWPTMKQVFDWFWNRLKNLPIHWLFKTLLGICIFLPVFLTAFLLGSAIFLFCDVAMISLEALRSLSHMKTAFYFCLIGFGLAYFHIHTEVVDWAKQHFQGDVADMEKIYPTPTVESVNLKGRSLNTLGRILNDYDSLYRNDPEVRRLANGLRDTLGIDGRKLYAALDFHESGGNGLLIGDLGLSQNAYGRFQLRSPALKDLRAQGWSKDLDDFTGNDPEALKNMVLAFHQYVALYLKPGEKNKLNAWLNTWNGGPNGTPKNTPYTHSVRSTLKNIRG